MGMEVKKGPALALIFLAMILHTNTSIGRATATLVMMRSNRSNGGCKGRLEECLIGDMDLDEELLIMDSEISRRMVYVILLFVGLGYFLLVEESPKPKHLRLLRP